uniref:Uncharacterized protein n=1 Tax=Nelumbo nucifera TaxID=4432 RepID=A0A822Z5W8_NELNU|nr:TPA_asm: hypothetical protein HUJ06_013101 [Nelumbo nucifera]
MRAWSPWLNKQRTRPYPSKSDVTVSGRVSFFVAKYLITPPASKWPMTQGLKRSSLA